MGLLFLQNNLFFFTARGFTVENMQGLSTKGEANGIEHLATNVERFAFLSKTEADVFFFQRFLLLR